MEKTYKFKTQPLPKQLEYFRLLRDKKFHAMLWEMGTGKTKVLIDNIAYLYMAGAIKAAVIVAPKGVYFNWVQQIALHMPLDESEYMVHLMEPDRALQKQTKLRQYMLESFKGLKIFIYNAEGFSFRDSSYCKTAKSQDKNYILHLKEIASWCPNNMLILDEAHLFKSSSSFRYKNLKKVANLYKYRRIATGTPFDKPEDIYAQFDLLTDVNPFGSNFLSFRSKYCITQKKYFGPNPCEVIVGYQNLDELREKILICGSILKKEDMVDLPPKIYEPIYVKLTPHQSQAYLSLEKDLEFSCNLDTVSVTGTLAKAQKLHQITSGVLHCDEEIHIFDEDPKFDALVNLLDKAGEEGKKVIIFHNVSSNAALLSLYNKLIEKRFKGCVYYGGTSVEERRQYVEDFQNGSYDFFLANETAAEGITLTNASYCVFYSNSFKRIKRQQAEDRAHRIGQDKSVVIVDLVALGTIDEHILTALKTKQRLADIILKSYGRDPEHCTNKVRPADEEI